MAVSEGDQGAWHAGSGDGGEASAELWGATGVGEEVGSAEDTSLGSALEKAAVGAHAGPEGESLA